MKVKTFTKWRNFVLERDSYACQLCGASANVADHIKPRSLAPELTLEISNGRVLCRSCRARYGSRYSSGRGELIHSPVNPNLIVGFAKIYEMGGSLVTVLPSEFTKRHKIQKGDTLPFAANYQLLEYIPMPEDADNVTVKQG